MGLLSDTAELRQKMQDKWEQFEKKQLPVADARVHIGFARVMLDSLKVEIAAQHLNTANIPPVSLRTSNGKARRLAS